VGNLLETCQRCLAPNGRIFIRESCEISCHNYSAWQVALEMACSYIPFSKRNFYNPYRFKIPPVRELWYALTHYEKPPVLSQGD